jgi:hypothetical protein
VTVAGQWLESPQINAAMTLIKMQFPYVGGLFDTTLGWDLNFPASTSETWIQIIHDGQDHWIVASKRKGDDFVSIFDSLGDTASDHVVGCISALLRPKENSFYYQNVACQQQLPNDCGLHAIANAVSLAMGEHPSECFYDRDVMRIHLKSCLQSNFMSSFPKSNAKKDYLASVSSQFKKVRVYCHCRRVLYNPLNSKKKDAWEAKECFSCKEWMHKMCDSTWPLESTHRIWLCQKCKGNLNTITI